MKKQFEILKILQKEIKDKRISIKDIEEFNFYFTYLIGENYNGIEITFSKTINNDMRINLMYCKEFPPVMITLSMESLTAIKQIVIKPILLPTFKE